MRPFLVGLSYGGALTAGSIAGDLAHQAHAAGATHTQALGSVGLTCLAMVLAVAASWLTVAR
jgi:hypothetical protein